MGSEPCPLLWSGYDPSRVPSMSFAIVLEVGILALMANRHTVKGSSVGSANASNTELVLFSFSFYLFILYK